MDISTSIKGATAKECGERSKKDTHKTVETNDDLAIAVDVNLLHLSFEERQPESEVILVKRKSLVSMSAMCSVRALCADSAKTLHYLSDYVLPLQTQSTRLWIEKIKEVRGIVERENDLNIYLFNQSDLLQLMETNDFIVFHLFRHWIVLNGFKKINIEKF